MNRYHILAEDKENLFAFAFRTFAKNSKGMAHIMEHSVLCGSEKYPLKEPFTTLNATCINTFLNALTYPDKTVYPAASTIRKDYFTMMDVYADAVFFPLLEHATFLQEGHRLELDEKGKLSIQGVVYNEMKGSYSSFQPVAYSKQINAMFPDCFASYESGGDPLEIPSLTYEEFLDFHKKFYAPDNCLLYLYGDIPTSEQLDFLNEKLIFRLEKKYNCTGVIKNAESTLPLIKPEIKKLQKLKKRNSVDIETIYDVAPETGASGNLVTLNYYSGKADIEKYFLSEVLFGNDSSPLSVILKESGLGDDEQCYNFGQFQEEFYTIGLWNVKKGDEEKLFELIQKSLQDIYEKGVAQVDIDSAVILHHDLVHIAHLQKIRPFEVIFLQLRDDLLHHLVAVDIVALRLVGIPFAGRLLIKALDPVLALLRLFLLQRKDLVVFVQMVFHKGACDGRKNLHRHRTLRGDVRIDLLHGHSRINIRLRDRNHCLDFCRRRMNQGYRDRDHCIVRLALHVFDQIGGELCRIIRFRVRSPGSRRKHTAAQDCGQ